MITRQRVSIDEHAISGVDAGHRQLITALAGGVTTSLVLDPHGKTRSSLILDLPVDVPDKYIPPRLREQKA